MTKISDVPVDALRERLADAEDPKEAKRLMVALAYKDGESVPSLSDRYGIPQSTLYHWLDRFESGSIEEAVTDADRPGRPSELNASERRELRATLSRAPDECGYEASEWQPSLLQAHIEREYGVSYSLGHVRRLIRRQRNETAQRR